MGSLGLGLYLGAANLNTGGSPFAFTYNGVPYTFGGVRYEYRSE